MPLSLHRSRPALKVDADGESVVVRFMGNRVSLNEETVPVLRARLDGLAAELGRRKLVLDFENVEFLTSTALGALLRVRKQIAATGGSFALRNPQEAVQEVFEVTRLAHLFEVERGGETAAETVLARQKAGAVLVVDDAEHIRSLLKLVLRHHGFEVLLAATGEDALECYRRTSATVAVVLLDVLLPGWSGPETLAALRRIDPEVCCCFMSGDLGPYTEEELFRLGAAQVFEKPFSLDDVVQTVLDLAERSVPATRDQP
jgi:anti-anti-sigma factor